MQNVLQILWMSTVQTSLHHGLLEEAEILQTLKTFKLSFSAATSCTLSLLVAEAVSFVLHLQCLSRSTAVEIVNSSKVLQAETKMLLDGKLLVCLNHIEHLLLQ